MIEDTHKWRDACGKLTAQIDMRQGDGSPPVSFLPPRRAGERGLHVSYYRFSGGVHIDVVPDDPFVVVQPLAAGVMQCRVADQRRVHAPQAWDITVSSANVACSAESSCDLDVVMVSVPKEALALVIADQARPDARLMSSLGGSDAELVAMCRTIAREAGAGFEEGPMFWEQLTDSFIDRLTLLHLSSPLKLRRGMLDQWALRRMRDYVHANISEAITIPALASAAGREHAHFARAFARSVGVTPHYYVVQTRLAYALRLIRTMRLSCAEAAVAAGFTDQSHFAKWVRRTYGVTPKSLTRG